MRQRMVREARGQFTQHRFRFRERAGHRQRVRDAEQVLRLAWIEPICLAKGVARVDIAAGGEIGLGESADHGRIVALQTRRVLQALTAAAISPSCSSTTPW